MKGCNKSKTDEIPEFPEQNTRNHTPKLATFLVTIILVMPLRYKTINLKRMIQKVKTTKMKNSRNVLCLEGREMCCLRDRTPKEEWAINKA
jgi:hypothetical protein